MNHITSTTFWFKPVQNFIMLVVTVERKEKHSASVQNETTRDGLLNRITR